MITASGVALDLLCAHRHAPGVVVPRSPKSPEAAMGTEVHAAIEATLEDRTSNTTTGEATELFTSWHSTWYYPHRAEGWRPEVAFALDPVAGTARELPRGSHRDYSAARPGEITGTADALTIDGKTLHLVDFKTGQHAPAARDNAQLLTLALAATIAYGLTRAVVSIVHVRPDGVRVDECEVDEFDLGAHQAALVDLLAEVPTAAPKPGPHCRGLYCQLFGVCPSTSQALTQIEEKPRLPIVVEASQITNATHAAYQYQFLRQVKARADRAWEALRQWADSNGGVPVSGNTIWAKSERARETIDLSTRGAVDALREALGVHAETALEHSTTKTAIESAARLVAKDTGESIKSVKARTLRALAEVGAVKTGRSVTYEEVKGKTDAA